MRLVLGSSILCSGHRLVKRLADFLGDLLLAMCAIGAIAFLEWTYITLAAELLK